MYVLGIICAEKDVKSVKKVDFVSPPRIELGFAT